MFQILKEETGYNTMIIIKSKCRDDEKDKKDEFDPNVDHTKEQLLRIITTCLNKPLQELLESWLANLETGGSSNQAADIKTEIEAICHQMEFDDCDESDVFVSQIGNTKSILPDDVKNYLFR